MKRRDMIKLGAVAAGVGAGVPGCALPKQVESMAGPEGAAQFNAMIDGQLAKMSRPGLLHALVDGGPDRSSPVRSPEAAAELAEKDALFRRMLGTLLVTQGFRELPPETQLDPAVQARLWQQLDEIGETVFEVSDMLASLDETQRARLRDTLRKRPDLPMEIGEVLDTHAASAGLSGARRRQLRQMMSQSAFRLRNGDPSSILDEYVAKVERVRATDASNADALALAKQLGERSFWRYQHLMAQAPLQNAGAPTSSGAPVQPPGAYPVQPPAGAAPPQRRPGSRGLRVGGYLLGIGVIVFGASALLVGASEAFLFGMTVGAVLFAIGLITLIVSAVIRASAD